METRKEKVIICPECKGTGLKYYDEYDPSVHNFKPIPKKEVCRFCNGERICLKITTIKCFLN
jgi:hypothetical protein